MVTLIKLNGVESTALAGASAYAGSRCSNHGCAGQRVTVPGTVYAPPEGGADTDKIETAIGTCEKSMPRGRDREQNDRGDAGNPNIGLVTRFDCKFPIEYPKSGIGNIGNRNQKPPLSDRNSTGETAEHTMNNFGGGESADPRGGA